MNLDRSQRWVLATTGLIAAITAGWWALALGPTAGSSPEWLVRAKNVCFGATETGLPNAGGWVLLIGQPAGMFGVLFVVWWSEVRGTVKALVDSPVGRAGLVLVALVTTAGVGTAGLRIARALDAARLDLTSLELPLTYPRLDREAPPLVLTDPSGDRVNLSSFVGRQVLITFGFGHCETVCPLVVHSARAVQEERGPADRPVVLVVTLDPWRDTPSRLPHLMKQWGLAEDAFVLSGSVDEVNATLDAWNVVRERDPQTGDVAHPALTYIVDASGRLAYATSGDRQALLDLLDRL